MNLIYLIGTVLHNWRKNKTKNKADLNISRFELTYNVNLFVIIEADTRCIYVT